MLEPLLSVLSFAVLAAPMRLPMLPIPVWSCCCGAAPSLCQWAPLGEASSEKDPLHPQGSPPSHPISQRWTHGGGNPFPVLLVIILAFSYSSSLFLPSFMKNKVALSLWIPTFYLVGVLILLLDRFRAWFLSAVVY